MSMNYASKNKRGDQGILLSLSLALGRCDMDTMQHCLRVGSNAKLVMEEYQRKYSPTVDYSPQILQWAATLHDVGKSRVPTKIIMKPTQLTPEERVIMMKHAAYGEQILSELFDPTKKVMMKCAHDVILYHHERYDGQGYPNHLVGDEIPLSAQLVGLADCYDALISARVYKAALLPEVAYRMIMDGECGMFSEQVLSCLPVLLNAKEGWGD